MDKQATTLQNSVISTGTPGLDHVLKGGLTPQRLYLIEGIPGTGKTTLALKFLLEGVRLGEPVLYITLSETVAELRAVAESHGWSMDGIQVHEVIPTEDLLDPAQQHTMFHPSEVELGDTTRDISAAVDRVKPKRVVIDSLSELRLLASNPLRYRRQVLAYKQFFSRRECTVLMLDDRPDAHDMQIRSIAHGVITLDQVAQEYGKTRHRVQITKYRGVSFVSGYHDYIIERGGLRVYPRLVASDTRNLHALQRIGTGIAELDTLLGGGIERGTSTIISGSPGTGKSTLALKLVESALSRQERAAIFVFEESANLMLQRAAAIGIELQPAIGRGQLSIQQIDPAELSMGQFTHAVREAVEQGAKVVVIDSIQGYLNAMPDERFLILHLHELLTYLGQQQVLTVLIGVQNGMVGTTAQLAVDTSYLADNVILLRHFEFSGRVHQAISVFKKRGGAHERTIREFSISAAGIRIGPALEQFHGVLTGIPTFEGQQLDTSEPRR